MATIEQRSSSPQETLDQRTPTGTPPPSAPVGDASRKLRRRWFAATAAGNTFAWTLPIAVYPLVAGLSAWQQLAVLLSAAVVGGAGLAVLQAGVLCRRLGSFVVRDWILVTAAAAVVEWAVIALVVVCGPEVAIWPVLAQAPTVASGMLVMAFALGIGQWFVLRRSSDQAVLWIWANAVAWIMGATIFTAVAELVGRSAAPAATFVIVVAALGSVLRGVVAALVTGTYLVPVLAPEHLRREE